MGEAPPGQRRPGAPGSGDATPLSDPSLKTGRARGADPHAGTNLEGSYGGQSADYYHGMIPVVRGYGEARGGEGRGKKGRGVLWEW